MISEDLQKFSGSHIMRTSAIGRFPIKNLLKNIFQKTKTFKKIFNMVTIDILKDKIKLICDCQFLCWGSIFKITGDFYIPKNASWSCRISIYCWPQKNRCKTIISIKNKVIRTSMKLILKLLDQNKTDDLWWEHCCHIT